MYSVRRVSNYLSSHIDLNDYARFPVLSVLQNPSKFSVTLCNIFIVFTYSFRIVFYSFSLVFSSFLEISELGKFNKLLTIFK